jgi:hypothetical protein
VSATCLLSTYLLIDLCAEFRRACPRILCVAAGHASPGLDATGKGKRPLKLWEKEEQDRLWILTGAAGRGGTLHRERLCAEKVDTVTLPNHEETSVPGAPSCGQNGRVNSLAIAEGKELSPRASKVSVEEETDDISDIPEFHGCTDRAAPCSVWEGGGGGTGPARSHHMAVAGGGWSERGSPFSSARAATLGSDMGLSGLYGSVASSTRSAASSRKGGGVRGAGAAGAAGAAAGWGCVDTSGSVGRSFDSGGGGGGGGGGNDVWSRSNSRSVDGSSARLSGNPRLIPLLLLPLLIQTHEHASFSS